VAGSPLESDKRMTQQARNAVTSRKKTPSAPAKAQSAKAAAAAVAANNAAYQHYQGAVQLVQQGKYEKALTALEKLLPDAPREISERVRMYIATCRRQLEHARITFQSAEERYNYAVLQLNNGLYEDAREHFQGVLDTEPKADYAWYGLALLECITNHPEECLEALHKAIRLNSRNRLQARTDNDFQAMADDPRFTELLYPEP
jgi:tetratricopeptide (TPR) repeat protein